MRTIIDLQVVAESYADNDDWNVPVIALGTLRELADALQAGDSPNRLKQHAKHTLAQCVRARCDLVIPYMVSHDEWLAPRLKERVSA